MTTPPYDEENMRTCDSRGRVSLSNRGLEGSYGRRGYRSAYGGFRTVLNPRTTPIRKFVA